MIYAPLTEKDVETLQMYTNLHQSSDTNTREWYISFYKENKKKMIYDKNYKKNCMLCFKLVKSVHCKLQVNEYVHNINQ